MSRFAHAVGALLVERDPEHLTQEFSKVDRGTRILVDTGRNGYSATFAAAYAVRAQPGAPVSAPCTWEEIERGDSRTADVHAAKHGRARRRGRRSVERHAQEEAIPHPGGGEAAEVEGVVAISYSYQLAAGSWSYQLSAKQPKLESRMELEAES